MDSSRRVQIISALKGRFPDEVMEIIDWPSPRKGGETTKAIVLGCDPTAFDRNGNLLRFDKVFNIGGEDNRYFRDIEENLRCIGLAIDHAYVQNLCQNYFREETSKNKAWREAAQIWIPYLKEELDEANIPRSVPALLTSQILYRALLNKGVKTKSATYLYEHPDVIPIPPELNQLERPLIPLYRHYKYRLFSKRISPSRIKYRKTLASIFR